MKEKLPLTGIVVSLNTPFDESGHVDFASMARLVEMHMREGAAGFLASAQAGEINELSLEERIEITRFVQQAAGDRVTVIAGATSGDPHASCSMAEAALKAGCSAVLVEIPQQFQSDRASTLRYCREVAQVGVPTLVIQDLDWSGSGLDVSWIVEMFETIESFKCLKVEVRPAGPKYTQVREATRGRLNVAGGWAADQMIEALDRGVDIFIPTTMTRQYDEIVREHHAGNREAAFAGYKAILPVLAFTRQHLDISIQFHKRQMVRSGLFKTANVRKKCVPYDRFHEAYGEEMMRYLDQLASARK